jgi:hypothetical protein
MKRRTTMTKKLCGLLLAFCSTGAHLALAQAQPNEKTVTNIRGPLEKMPVSLEVSLALSALPPTFREKASVYVLDPAKGYILERAGSNWQSCFVGRTEWKFADYRNDVYDPICYDAVGAKNHMRVWFDVAELRAKGVKPEAMKQEIEARFRAGVYKAPEHPGVSYMTAPLMRSYMSLDPKDNDSVMTMSMPHVMYYAPNVTAADIGGMPCPPCAPYPFVFEPGPHGFIIQRLGDAESARIVVDEAGLVSELCSYRSALCLATDDSGHSHSN